MQVYEMINAMMDGKRLVNSSGAECYYDNGNAEPFRFVSNCGGESEVIKSAWYGKWQVKVDGQSVIHPVNKRLKLLISKLRFN